VEQLNLVKTQVGIEAMLIIVSNNVETPAAPEVYFTDPRLERYMPIAVGNHWRTFRVLSKMHAFALASLDASRT
jgi:hypothetical protein